MNKREFTYDVTPIDNPSTGDLFQWPSSGVNEPDRCGCIVSDCLTADDLQPLEEFIAAHNLRHYDPAFVVSDIMSLYVNETVCFWFMLCCDMGYWGGFCQLHRVTSLPVVRHKTTEEVDRERQLRAEFADHIKAESGRIRGHEKR